jgi:hypothetical protein
MICDCCKDENYELYKINFFYNFDNKGLRGVSAIQRQICGICYMIITYFSAEAYLRIKDGGGKEIDEWDSLIYKGMQFAESFRDENWKYINDMKELKRINNDWNLSLDVDKLMMKEELK